MGYTYFDTPDGQDCDKKILYLTKKAGLIGIACSTTAVTLLDSPTGYLQTLVRFARITIPFVAVSVAGAASVCLLVDLRKKDDQLNHLYGGFIGGLAGGLAKGHFGHGLAAGAVLGAVAMCIKDAKMHNRRLETTNYVQQTDDYWTKNYDWTVTKKISPDWIQK